MELKDLITERNKELYETVSKSCKINLLKNKNEDNVSWGAEYKNTYANIYYSNSAHPEEAFVHELLHIYIQQNGYKKPYYAIPKNNPELFEQLTNFVQIPLDNELQHHKMFQLYLKLGYKPEFFYNDNDKSEVIEEIENFINGPIQETIYMVIKFLTVIAPLGENAFDNYSEVKEKIKNKSDLDFKHLLEQIEQRILIWQTEDTFNNEAVISDIIKLLPYCNDNVCIKYNENAFKQDGDYFIGNQFKYSLKKDGKYYKLKFLE